jgi:phosphate starvation-inducible PhoH-like protein
LTPGQRNYLENLQNNIVTLCAGAPGTGKTWMAVGYAVELLLQNKIQKIVISRPIVSTGEHLGYLPGTAEDKASPYMQPLYDAFSSFLTKDEYTRYKGMIEMVPLAYMRGRTFKNAFIIGDEFQNASIMQCKMFVSRMGDNSKLVMCGDTKQSDIREKCGLTYCIEKLAGLDGVGIAMLTQKDVVRSGIVQRMIERLGYE